MTIGRKMGLGYGLVLALVVTLAVVVLFNLANMHRQFSFVIQHDAPVIANARHLSKLVVDMETGQRGFVITGKEEFLEPYESAVASFSGLLNEEKILVSDNPAQVKLLEEIEASVLEWKEKAAGPEIAMRRRISEASVDAYHLQEILSEGVGKRTIDSFMALGHEVEVFFSERGDWEGAFAVEIIEKSMADREDGQRGFLITGKEEFLDKYTAGEQRDLPAYFTRLRGIVSDRNFENELTGKIDQLERLAADWTHKAAEPEIEARRLMNKHPESLRDVAALLEIGTGKRILDRIREDFRKFIDEEERLTAERFASSSQASSRTRNTTILLAFISVILGGFIAMRITQGITNPVRALASAVGEVAEGDLDQKIEIKSKDEIGALSKSFNRMVNDLKRLEDDRKKGEQALLQAHDELENRVRERTEELIQSQLRQSLLLESTQAIPWEADAKSYQFTYVGSQAGRLLGYSPQKWSDLDFWKLHIHPEDQEFAIEYCLRSTECKDNYEFEYRMIAQDGRTIWIHDIVNVERKDGEPKTLRGFMIDITERKQAEEVARESSKRLTKAQQVSRMGFLDLNLKTNEIAWSKEVYNLYGIDSDTPVTLEQTVDLVHPDDREFAEQNLNLAIEGRRDLDHDHRVVRPDGKVIWVHARADLERDKEGKPVSLIGTVVDITDRKRLEAEVAETNKRTQRQYAELEQLYKNTPVGLCLVDRDFRFIRINKMLADINGSSANEHIGKTVRDIIPLLADEVERSYGFVFETGEALVDIEINGTTLASPNDLRSWLVSYYPMTFDDGEACFVNTVVQDVTERKQAEELLKDSEARFRMIYENAPVMIDAFDENGRCVMFNKECEKVFGWTGEEVFSHENPIELFYPDPEVQRKVIETVTSKPEKIFREWKARTRDGSEILCLWANFKLPDGQVINLGYDITEQENAKDKLRRNRDDMRVLARRLITAHEDERRRIARELHDDLSQRLASIAIDSSMLESEIRPVNGSGADKLAKLSDRIRETSVDVHQVSRQLHPSILDELGLVKAMQAECDTSQRRSGIALHFDGPSEYRSFPKSVELALYRIMQECLRNIEKHSRAVSATVALSANEDSISLTVTDTGTGFDPTQQREKPGLGMASLKERAGLLGGTVTIQSEIGCGTTVTAHLPANAGAL